MEANQKKNLKSLSNQIVDNLITFRDIEQHYESVYNLEINNRYEPLFKASSFHIFKLMANNTIIGLSKDAFNRIIDMKFLTQTAWARVLDLSPRTLQRYIQSDANIFDRLRIEKIIEVSSVMFRGTEVFGNQQLFKEWLNASNPALDKMRPIELLESNVGTSVILQMLGKIEHGIFA